MKPAPFEYVAAGSVEEAVELLAQHGGEARVLAGGQSLVAMMNLRMARPAVLVDVNRVSSLAGWGIEDGKLHIGALTRQRVLEHDRALGAYAPLFAQCVRFIGHVATRSRGTIGGSAHADPSAELPVCALALDARLHARSKRGTRVIEASTFFDDVFTTTLAVDELLEVISLKPAPAATGTSFEEVSRRPGDFAMVAVACCLTLDHAGRVESARIALGGVGSRPVRVAEAEALLTGERPAAELWRAAGAEAARGIEPSSDIHATADYRRDVAAVLVQRALVNAAELAEKGMV